MSQFFREIVGQAISDPNFIEEGTIQSLWSGYGRIVRVRSILDDHTFVVKHIKFPTHTDHPKGWSTRFSHERKVKSYEVEMNWYRDFQNNQESLKYPKCFGTYSHNEEHIIILQDVNALGFSARKSDLTLLEIKSCLSWLATFHATNLNVSDKGLWDRGSYWHLSTRPDEFTAMPNNPLKKAASRIDDVLNNCKYQTIIHGDAKVANFCFAADANVMAVDFQYTGKGCGMKDVAYFLSSCLTDQECESQEKLLLDYYFNQLKKHISQYHEKINFNELEKEWRELYYYAWADFVRFLQGWMPGHYKINQYSLAISDRVINELTD
ncbi:MAG: hypothetical protein ACI9J3_002862 [Parvicellaceae bacterium]|jgi:hypothetical protein